MKRLLSLVFLFLISRKNTYIIHYSLSCKLHSFFILLILLLCNVSSYSQGVAINEDSSDPDASAILDVKSINKGVLMPRLTTVQRDDISSPVAGLIIYNVSVAKYQYYNGSSWVDFSGEVVWSRNTVSGYIFPSNITDFLGIGLNTPTASTHVKGSGATSATYGLKIDNSADAKSLYVRNDGQIEFKNYTFPTADGASNQVLTTDGAGTLEFKSLDDVIQPAIFFSVAKTANQTATAGTVITWDVEHEDSGNCFNMTLNRFEVPVDGTYYLSAQIMNATDGDMGRGRAMFYKNGVATKIASYATQVSQGQAGAMSAVMTLEAGDYIDIRVDATTHKIWGSTTQHITKWSGFSISGGVSVGATATNVSYVLTMGHFQTPSMGVNVTVYIGPCTYIQARDITYADYPYMQQMVPKTGRITAVTIMTTVGSTYASAGDVSTRVYNLTKGTHSVIHATQNRYTSGVLTNRGRHDHYDLASPLEVDAGDVIQIQLIVPYWATSPQTVTEVYNLYIEN